MADDRIIWSVNFAVNTLHFISLSQLQSFIYFDISYLLSIVSNITSNYFIQSKEQNIVNFYRLASSAKQMDL